MKENAYQIIEIERNEPGKMNSLKVEAHTSSVASAIIEEIFRQQIKVHRIPARIHLPLRLSAISGSLLSLSTGR
jgi:translation elongation factor P/translation initiation factor 5A